MKLTYLANVRFPSERAHAAQIAHMSQAFAQLVDVTVVAAQPGTSDTDSFPPDYFGFTPQYSTKLLHNWSLAYRAKPFYYINSFWFTLQYRLRHHDSNVIVYCRDEILIALLLLFFVPARRLVFESHEAKLNWPARFLLRCGVRTVVISDAIRDDYLACGVPASQLLVAYDGIDESFFEAVVSKEAARKNLGLPLNESIVMYIGGFDTWKGIDTFCAAANYSDKSFTVIGGSTEQVTRYRNRYPKVQFLGAKPYRELKDHQQAADALVVPNGASSPLGARYTSPLKLFAHMASGVPLVVTNVPSLVGVTGTDQVQVVEPDSPPALATEVDKIFKNYTNAKNKARTLQATSAKYLWTARAKDIISFITT